MILLVLLMLALIVIGMPVAFALGVGAYWRTGSLAYSPEVQRLLKMSENEKIVGFIYLGTPAGKLRTPKAVDINDFYRPWQGQWQGL